MKYYQIVLDTLEYINKNKYYPYDKVEVAISALSLTEKKLTAYLIMETLRKLVLIDFVLSKFLTKPKKLPEKILNILRIGTMQIIFSENYSNKSSVNDMVDLVANERFKKLVNAVLRKVSRENWDFSEFPENIKYSHPLWIFKKIKKSYKKSYRDILIQNTMKPDFTYKFTGNDEELERNGYDFIPGLRDGSFVVFEKGNMTVKMKKIDPIEDILKGEFNLPVFLAPGTQSSLICEKPWLLKTLTQEEVEKSSKRILKEISEIEDDRFIYYNSSFFIDENTEVLKKLKGYEVIRVKINKMKVVNDDLMGNFIIANQTLRPSYFAMMRKIND